MSRVLVIGGGVVGLSAALMLLRDGHDVTVLERDGGIVPGSPQEAWQAWERQGVAQFRQPHYLHPAGYRLLGETLPEVAQALDRRRRLVVNGTPVITGLVAVGDSACCTNPSLGRGITMGLMHAAGTAEVIGQHLDDPLTLAAEHDQMTQARVIPWYQATVEFDRARKAQIDAAIEGRPAPPPTGPGLLFQQAFGTAMLYDPDIFRAMMDIVAVHALPAEVFSRPGFAGQVAAVAEAHEPFAPPAPSRAEPLDMLA